MQNIIGIEIFTHLSAPLTALLFYYVSEEQLIFIVSSSIYINYYLFRFVIMKLIRNVGIIFVNMLLCALLHKSVCESVSFRLISIPISNNLIQGKYTLVIPQHSAFKFYLPSTKLKTDQHVPLYSFQVD